MWGQLPPAGAEQSLQRVEAFQLLLMAQFAQAAEQRCREGGGQLQPVTVAGVFLAVIHPAQQPCAHAQAVAVGHQKTIGIAKQALQAWVFAVATVYLQAHWRRAAQAVEAGAQGLAVAPEYRRIVGGVTALDAPRLALLIQQGDGDAGDVPVLGNSLQSVLQYFGQAHQAADPQLLADLVAHPLIVFAHLGELAMGNQVANVQQLQEPALAFGLNPATGMQGLPGEPLELQVQALPLPVAGRALDHQAARRSEVVEQRGCLLLLRSGVFESMAKRAMDIHYAALGVQVEQQRGGCRDRCRCVSRQLVATSEQAAEEFIA